VAGTDAERPHEWWRTDGDALVESRLRALYHPPEPDPAFVAQLEEDLMLTRPIAVLALDTSAQPTIPNGRVVPSPTRLASTASPRLHSGRHRWALAQFSTAALLMLLAVGSLFLFGPGRPDRKGDSPAIVPAISSAPATPEPPPSAGPIEFLWETRGDPADPLGNPAFLAVAPDGAIWVTDGDHDRFLIFSPDGGLIESWGETGSGEGQFDFTTRGWGGYPHGAIAFAPDGGFYVADPGNFRIQRFGPDRRFLTAWGSEGTEPGQFRTANDLVVDGQGRVYVLDTDRAGPGTGAVQVFDADGQYLTEWGGHGSKPGQLNGPSGIGLDPADGTLLVVEFGGNRVQRFTPEGELLDGWGEGGSGEGQFIWPMDAAVDAAGHVFVADYSNNRVQVFDHDGRFLAAWGKSGTGPGEFSYALGVAVGNDGTVYVTEEGRVTDEGKRLQAFRVGDLPVAAPATPAPAADAEGTPSG
jgi:DNA-binding beta-propeller fold protein YncE